MENVLLDSRHFTFGASAKHFAWNKAERCSTLVPCSLWAN